MATSRFLPIKPQNTTEPETNDNPTELQRNNKLSDELGGKSRKIIRIERVDGPPAGWTITYAE